MARGVPIKHFCLVIGLALTSALYCPQISAEDAHDGDDNMPGFDAVEDASNDNGASRNASFGIPVVERASQAGAQLRDPSGKLLPPPNFRTASLFMEKAIDIARNPTPSPLAAKAPPPEVEIDTLPTYTGGAPNPKVGFIGVDLKPEATRPLPEDYTAAARNESAYSEKKVKEATAGQITSALNGKITAPAVVETSEQNAEKEKKRAAVEAEKISRIGRMPASFTKPKLGSTP